MKVELPSVCDISLEKPEDSYGFTLFSVILIFFSVDHCSLLCALSLMLFQPTWARFTQ